MYMEKAEVEKVVGEENHEVSQIYLAKVNAKRQELLKTMETRDHNSFMLSQIEELLATKKFYKFDKQRFGSKLAENFQYSNVKENLNDLLTSYRH